MKKKFVNNSLKFIKKNNPTFDDVKLAELKYGLEGIYLTYTKMIIILLLAIFLGRLKECLLLILTYNGIRTFAYGLHASKSIYCLISSLVFFIGGIYICEFVTPFLSLKIILGLICLICIIRYAPADTKKRPLVNKKKRFRYKLISSCLAILYLVLIIIYANSKLSNYLLLGMIEATLMIHPLIYKMFHLSFNNYKNYKSVVV